MYYIRYCYSWWISSLRGYRILSTAMLSLYRSPVKRALNRWTYRLSFNHHHQKRKRIESFVVRGGEVCESYSGHLSNPRIMSPKGERRPKKTAAREREGQRESNISLEWQEGVRCSPLHHVTLNDFAWICVMTHDLLWLICSSAKCL